jgi:hypothetical protein
MQRAEMEVMREVIFSAAATSIDSIELTKLVTKLHELVIEILNENTSEIDQKILVLHYDRRMRFSGIAAEIGITESLTKRRWARLIETISESLQTRVRSDQQLASVLSSMTENPHAYRFAVSTLLSAQNARPETNSPELDILKRAVETFGSHADAVRWLLEDCPALNGRPIDLVIDPRGVQNVENVLGCIDHGMIY